MHPACTKGGALTAYDLHWIDGPKPGDDRAAYDRRAHLHVSEPTMAALREEMERQELIGDKPGQLSVAEWEARLESGQEITRNELVVTVTRVTNAPAPLILR